VTRCGKLAAEEILKIVEVAYDSIEISKTAKLSSTWAQAHRIERPILTAKGLSWGTSSGEEMGGGADDLLANQASQPPHALVQEGGELVGLDSVGDLLSGVDLDVSCVASF
jgi:hypothetical protein